MESAITLNARAEDAGCRLDVFLSECLGVSRSRAAKAGAVSEGVVLKKSYILSGGETLSVTLPRPEPVRAEPEDIPLDIAHEDDDLLVICKPRGMVVHPAPGHPSGTLVNALLYRCRGTLSTLGGEFRPGIVHRLDRDTSGLMLAAKNDFTHRALCDALRERTVKRVYRAFVRGSPNPAEGVIDAPIGRHKRDRLRMAVVKDGRPALTKYTVLHASHNSLVECRLETGRTHQIRVHMAYIGHPVVGDELYGGGSGGQRLHACELEFTHPRTGERMKFEREPWF